MVKVLVGTSPVQILPPAPNRKSLTIENASPGGVTVYVSNGPKSGLTDASADYHLPPGQAQTWNQNDDGKDIGQEWSAIADGAGGVLYVKDMFDREV